MPHYTLPPQWKLLDHLNPIQIGLEACTRVKEEPLLPPLGEDTDRRTAGFRYISHALSFDLKHDHLRWNLSLVSCLEKPPRGNNFGSRGFLITTGDLSDPWAGVEYTTPRSSSPTRNTGLTPTRIVSRPGRRPDILTRQSP